MNIQDWKIFDKSGSNINWNPDPLIPMIFDSVTGKDANGYLLTSPDLHIVKAEITNGGYLYGTDTSVYYIYALDASDQILFPGVVSYDDVQIFGSMYDASTDGNTFLTKSINSISVNIPTIWANNYGALYNWYAVTDTRKITSSDDWIVPANTDYNTLGAFLGGTSVAGNKMKVSGFIFWNSPNAGTNDSSFNSVGSGIRYDSVASGTFAEINTVANYWCTTVTGGSAYRAALSYNTSLITVSPTGKARGCSVRLLKTSTTLTDGQSGVYIGNNGKSYKTICIGTQEWLAENLDETSYRNGDSIEGPIFTNTNWMNLITGARCYYNNSVGEEPVSNNEFLYPSVTFAGAVFLKPVSVGLVETEHLFVLESYKNELIRPYDTSNNILVFQMDGDDNEIQFFQVNTDTNEITWSDSVAFDTSIYATNTPISLNIGFRSEFEGVFERTIRVYHIVDTVLYEMANIIVNAEAIGEDERFRTLLTNFGLPDPKDMKEVFKETNINEDLPDWEVLNYKSKHMILEHDNIMPYVGTYKGLINAIKWLGYDDISIREWFLNVKENKKLSFLVPFDAKDRTQTLLMFNADQRKSFKKLNQLSLEYCISRDTGLVDDWGTPTTENCYSYNIKEVFIKLMGLKSWLEKNIIGVNCRITDITGDGIYYERIQNLIYSTDNIEYAYSLEQTLTPYSITNNNELICGSSNLRLSFLELENTTVDTLKCRFADLVESAWNPNDPSVYYSLNDPSYLANPSDFLLMGASFQFPFVNISDIMWRVLVDNHSGVLGTDLVSNPLFVYENEIRFYDVFDTSSYFKCASTNLTVLLENGYLRDSNIDTWEDSIVYHIYPDASKNHDYIMESSSGSILYFDGYVTFLSDTSSILKYEVDSTYKVPLLSFQYFRCTDASGNVVDMDKPMVLDIMDGKIFMDASVTSPTTQRLSTYINWNYDVALYPDPSTLVIAPGEQLITMSNVYDSPRMDLCMTDPSNYYWADPDAHSGANSSTNLIIDNSVYSIEVNHVGDYFVELFAWDGYNTLMHNIAKTTTPVWIKSPTFYSITNTSSNEIVTDISTIINNEKFPIYDRVIPMQGLSVNFDEFNKPYIVVPSITYFQDVPVVNSVNKFFNLTENVLIINNPSTLVINTNFENFKVSDSLVIVKFDKGKYSFIQESSTFTITDVSVGGNGHITVSLNSSLTFGIDTSTDLYALNTTLRSTSTSSNVSGKFVTTLSDAYYTVGQNVNIVITSLLNGYSWGATYRVIDVSVNVYTFDNPIPEFLLDAGTYKIEVKHAWSSYAEMSILTESATEVLGDNGNEFRIYLKESYNQEYYLDDTFTLINLLFDQNVVNNQWYNTSDDMLNSNFYYHTEPIIVDVSTLVVLQAKYDPSTYLLNQKNIWQVIEHDTSTLVYKVFNTNVPYIYDKVGKYDVECTAYDSYGNAITKKYQGLIEVK